MHDSLLQEHVEWCRHSVCSIEGDALISNIQQTTSDSSDYLIPSLLVLKKKVDRVFGSQKVVSLSENRANVDENTCGDKEGYQQFFYYAKSLVHQSLESEQVKELEKGDSREISRELSRELSREGEVLKTGVESHDGKLSSQYLFDRKEDFSQIDIPEIESELDSLDILNDEEEILKFLTEEEKKDITECQSLVTEESVEEADIHSSILLSFISQFEKPMESQLQLEAQESQEVQEVQEVQENQENHTHQSIYRSYSYSIQPPSREVEVHEKKMKEMGIPFYHYDFIGEKKEFNPNDIINPPSIQEDTVNRIQFWKDVFKDQIHTEYECNKTVNYSEQLLFNSYVYQKQPPSISVHSHSKTQQPPIMSSSSFSQIQSNLPSTPFSSISLSASSQSGSTLVCQYHFIIEIIDSQTSVYYHLNYYVRITLRKNQTQNSMRSFPSFFLFP